MRLAFLLVLALVAVGVARGDFASGEARSAEAPLVRFEADSLAADTTRTPEARSRAAGASRALLSRLRARVAPEAD
ncbi:hypothetical protein [Rubricoccus marinus]|uniref:Uncharacterized protein n=1 Tax=Rubricoccus marinus TaxID=716817 RepID=A0A259TVP1_9BACT|nr:hypothetical protein [Rubricoccus marinus]OZC01644.1 hypothetical protein BSZ36_00785 [Rubricoccus marinus]